MFNLLKLNFSNLVCSIYSDISITSISILSGSSIHHHHSHSHIH